MLGGEVLVGEVLAHLVGFVEDVAEGPAELGLGAIGVGQFVEDEFGLVARGDDVDLDPVQERKDNPLFLAEQGEQQVFRNDLRVRGGPTEFGGRREGFGCFERPTIGIERHGGTRVPVGEASKLECLTQLCPGLMYSRSGGLFVGVNSAVPFVTDRAAGSGADSSGRDVLPATRRGCSPAASSSSRSAAASTASATEPH